MDADIDERLEDADPEPKKGISPPILILLILAVIVAAAYGGYKLLTSMGIAIPFISQPEPSKVSDSGNLNIKTADISSRFIDNAKFGKLFVISGKVKNEYPAARGAIQIAGKIYTKDKGLAKTRNRILRQYSFGRRADQCRCGHTPAAASEQVRRKSLEPESLARHLDPVYDRFFQPAGKYGGIYDGSCFFRCVISVFCLTHSREIDIRSKF